VSDLRYHDMASRVLLTLVLLGLATLANAGATTPPPPTSKAFEPAPAHARDGGVLSGKIVGIDYVRGWMSVRAPHNRMVDVYVMPSTNIQGRTSGYYTIADLKRGENVEVFTSVIGSRTNAQIIKLK